MGDHFLKRLWSRTHINTDTSTCKSHFKPRIIFPKRRGRSPPDLEKEEEAEKEKLEKARRIKQEQMKNKIRASEKGELTKGGSK